MPEGDTVWLTAKRLHDALAGRQIGVFELRIARYALADLRGVSVTDVVARGKHILIRFGNGQTLHTHLRMDGSWHIVRAGNRPPVPGHQIRALVGNAEWLAVGRRVHDIGLIASADEDKLVGHLGPDLLAPDWDADEAVRRLGVEPDRPIGEALLDQRNLAGVGNLYRSEMLFLERINPWAPVRTVRHLSSLLATGHRLLNGNRSHVAQSTTGFLARGQQHWVYRRAGEPCLRCGTPIERGTLGTPPDERSVYWCPTCQAP